MMEDAGIDEDVRNFNPDFLVIDELERRRELERATSHAAEVAIDLSEHGPLYRTVLKLREIARASLSELIDADPKDAVLIATLQNRVRNYTDVCQIVDNTLKEAAAAEQIIAEQYGEQQPED